MQMTDCSGLLNVYKPAGVTSFWVVRQVRRILQVKRVGHCGTLDPLAEGVLLILFGRATRQQAAFMDGTKIYRARMLLGTVTDTGDTTGRVLRQTAVPAVTATDLQNLARRFTGAIQQVPPMYSALKHQGQRLYAIARAGGTVERQPRTVTIYQLEFLQVMGETLEFRVSCSRGTYVRTLIEDMGAVLGCGATMSFLVREQSGTFTASAAFDGAALSQATREELLAASRCVDPVSSGLAV
jgi:tRNA pseudouridine55 synthase